MEIETRRHMHRHMAINTLPLHLRHTIVARIRNLHHFRWTTRQGDKESPDLSSTADMPPTSHEKLV